MTRRRYSSNAELGSIMYRIIYLSLLYIGIKLFGMDVFNDPIPFIIGIVSFELVPVVLRSIGIWKY